MISIPIPTSCKPMIFLAWSMAITRALIQGIGEGGTPAVQPDTTRKKESRRKFKRAIEAIEGVSGVSCLTHCIHLYFKICDFKTPGRFG